MEAEVKRQTEVGTYLYFAVSVDFMKEQADSRNLQKSLLLRPMVPILVVCDSPAWETLVPGP